MAAVVLIGVGIAGFKYLYEHRVNAPVSPTLRLPTTVPSNPDYIKALGKWQHIGARSEDPSPPTIDQLFPPQFELNGSSFVRTAANLTKTCSLAVYGANLQAALQNGDCTEVLRASYVSGPMMGTIGVIDLESAERRGQGRKGHRAAGDHRAARREQGRHEQARHRHRGRAGGGQGALPDPDVGRVHRPEVTVDLGAAAGARAVRHEPCPRQREHQPQHPDADRQGLTAGLLYLGPQPAGLLRPRGQRAVRRVTHFLQAQRVRGHDPDRGIAGWRPPAGPRASRAAGRPSPTAISAPTSERTMLWQNASATTVATRMPSSSLSPVQAAQRTHGGRPRPAPAEGGEIVLAQAARGRLVHGGTSSRRKYQSVSCLRTGSAAAGSSQTRYE